MLFELFQVTFEGHRFMFLLLPIFDLGNPYIFGQRNWQVLQTIQRSEKVFAVSTSRSCSRFVLKIFGPVFCWAVISQFWFVKSSDGRWKLHNWGQFFSIQLPGWIQLSVDGIIHGCEMQSDTKKNQKIIKHPWQPRYMLITGEGCRGSSKCC